MELILNRDSVAAGDDLDSHERRLTVSDFMTLRQLFQLVDKIRYLPTISGGKASWSVWAGRPLAIVAQEWDDPEFIAPSDKPLDADPLRVHFSYHAQKSPVDVLAEVTKTGDQPAEPRRPSLVNGEEFISKYLAATTLGKEHLMREGVELSRTIHTEAVSLGFDKRTESSPAIYELFFLAAKIALLVLDRESSERQRYERDIETALRYRSPLPLVVEYERFKKALST